MPEPTHDCPYCGNVCYADWVSVGFGPYDVQCGPYYCQNCKASQIGPFDGYDASYGIPKPGLRTLTKAEKETGWYAPGTPISRLANQIDGVPIDHLTAKSLYRAGFSIKPRT